MKLSNKGRYAIQAVFDLAYHTEGKAAQIKDICERQAIPSRFLEQLFQDLKKAGIVRSKRGPRGGGDVVRAIEGPIALGPGEAQARATSYELLVDTLGTLSRQMEACLDAVSIADLCERAEREGLARVPTARYVYAI
jgi:Rrf2 family protein